MKRTVISLVVFASLFVLGVVPNAQARHDHECSNASLKGKYTWITDGTNVPSGTPVRSVGFATFDGEGNLSVTNTDNNNGTITDPNHFEATYTVNQDCTGHFERLPPVSAHWKLMVIDGGEEAVSLRIDPVRVATGMLKKQSFGDDKKHEENEE